MFLANLEVEDFRNWQAVELAFPQRVTLIEGGNAQGKTNLLEAIYILLTLHSFRSRRHEEMIRFGAGGFFLRGTLGGDGRPPRQVVIGVEPGRRTAMLDGKRTSRSPAPAVVFSPEDLALVEDGADLRRRYLDRMAALEAPAHDDDVIRARRVLQQRNRLLALRDGNALPPWDEELVPLYARILVRRRRAADRIARDLGPAYRALADGEAPAAVYRPSAAVAEAAVAAVEAAIGHAVAAARHRELAAGMSLVGPHRDDLLLTLDGRDACRYGSRGQRRTLALALRALEVEAVRRETGQEPILLLDDPFSELDGGRRAHLLGYLAGRAQVVATCTERPPGAPPLPEAAVYRAEAGTLRRG